MTALSSQVRLRELCNLPKVTQLAMKSQAWNPGKLGPKYAVLASIFPFTLGILLGN